MAKKNASGDIELTDDIKRALGYGENEEDMKQQREEQDDVQDELAMLRKQLEEKERELAAREAALAAKDAPTTKSDVPVQAVPVNAREEAEKVWKEKRSVFIPRAMGGEQKFVMVGVNGRRYQVPRGKTVEVPLPLYERIMIMLEAETKAQEYQEKLRQDSEENNVLKRIV